MTTTRTGCSGQFGFQSRKMQLDVTADRSKIVKLLSYFCSVRCFGPSAFPMWSERQAQNAIGFVSAFLVPVLLQQQLHVLLQGFGLSMGEAEQTPVVFTSAERWFMLLHE